MIWDVTFKQDTDTFGDGTVAVSSGTIFYSRRVNTNIQEEVDKFLNEVRNLEFLYQKNIEKSNEIANTIKKELDK